MKAETAIPINELATRPCVGCGYCCTKAQCALSSNLFGIRPICPALNWNGKRHLCLLMTTDTMRGVPAREIRERLYEGAGCCSPLNTWRRDIKDRTKRTEVLKTIG